MKHALLLTLTFACISWAGKRPELIAMDEVVAVGSRVAGQSAPASVYVPPSARTDCHDAGSTMRCDTSLYPGGSIPLPGHIGTIYNEVQKQGIVYTVRCDRYRIGSACMSVMKGQTYIAERRGDEIYLYGSRPDYFNGGTEELRQESHIIFERDAKTGQPIPFPHKIHKGWYYGPIDWGSVPDESEAKSR